MFYISEAMPFKEVHGARGAVFHLQIITKTNVTQQNTQGVKKPIPQNSPVLPDITKQPNVFTMDKPVYKRYEAVLSASAIPLIFVHQSQLTCGHIRSLYMEYNREDY